MPEISRFYGIVIKMFFKPREHEPSHIHALYGEHIGIAVADIKAGEHVHIHNVEGHRENLEAKVK